MVWWKGLSKVNTPIAPQALHVEIADAHVKTTFVRHIKPQQPAGS